MDKNTIIFILIVIIMSISILFGRIFTELSTREIEILKLKNEISYNELIIKIQDLALQEKKDVQMQ